MKAIKMLIAGLVLAVAGMATAAMDTVLTFSTVGPDRYADGDDVVTGESYALVWTADVSGFTLSDDGTATGGKVVLVAPVAEGGRCPPVKLNIKASVAPQYDGGVWGVYLFDTRSGSVSGVKLIPSATVEVASEGYLVRKTTKSRALLGSSAGIDDAESLSEAVAAGGEVTLAADITLANELVLSNEVTLNLGVYKINAANGKNAIRVAAGGSLTINAEENGGVSAPGKLAVYADYELDPGSKTVVINGGTYTGNLQFNKYPVATSATQSGEAAVPTVVTINGGVFNDYVTLYHCCPFTITGGKFEKGLNTSPSSTYVYSTSRSPVIIEGGVFKTEPEAVGSRVVVSPGYYMGGYFHVGDTSACEVKRNGKFYRYASEALALIGATTEIEVVNGTDLSGVEIALSEGQSITVSADFVGTVVAAAGYTLAEPTYDTSAGTVTYFVQANGVAKIGGAYYGTLDAAFGAAQDGDKITLLASCELNGAVALTGKAVEVALNGNDLTLASTSSADLTGGKLTISGAGNVFVNTAAVNLTKDTFAVKGGTYQFDPSAYRTATENGFWWLDRHYVINNGNGTYTVVPIPKAYVTKLDETQVSDGTLETAYAFKAFGDSDLPIAFKWMNGLLSDPLEIARANEVISEMIPFLAWNSDFVVYIDRDIEQDDVVLSGQYGSYPWLSFDAQGDVPANKKMRLLSMFGGKFSYEDICKEVTIFNCGAKGIDQLTLDGATMHVELRVYDPSTDTGSANDPSILVCEYCYSFGGYLARVGENRYDTMEAALEAVENGGVITMLNNWEGSVDLAPTAGKGFSINRNGYMLDVASYSNLAETWRFERMSNGGWSHYPKPEGTYKVEVVTDSGENMSLSTVKVDDQWIADNADGDAAQVEEVLAKTDDNGLQKWQNYILQQDPETPVTIAEKELEATAEPVPETTVVTVVNQMAERTMLPEDCGFKVTYQLDEVSSEGKVVAEGESKASANDDFEIDLETATGGEEKNHAFYRMSAVIESVDGTGTKTKVQSENTIGVLKVEAKTTNTPVAVPWSSLSDGEDITVDKLVRTATLTPGDTMTAYNNADGTYKAWELQEDGTWEPVQTVGGSEQTEAKDFEVSRGSAVWVTRQNPEHPLYLVGGATEEAAATPLEPATEEDKSWNLVAAPSVEPVKIDELLAENTDGDTIVVPTDGAPKNYYQNKDGVWGYDTVEEVFEGDEVVGVRSVFKTDDTTIPAGTGFWYLNGSTDGSKTVEW